MPKNRDKGNDELPSDWLTNFEYLKPYEFRSRPYVEEDEDEGDANEFYDRGGSDDEGSARCQYVLTNNNEEEESETPPRVNETSTQILKALLNVKAPQGYPIH